MSSPSGVSGNNTPVGIREGTRVILREITANLQNSPPATSPRRKNGNEASSIKADQQHDIKVRFIREFADANGTTVRDIPPESSSLSSASSFQSLASELSSKCSSGICVDSSPSNNADRSYLSADISGLDDLISACQNIRLNDESLHDLTKEQSFALRLETEDQSPDQTFTSASDRTSLDHTREDLSINSPNNIDCNITSDVAREKSPINCPNKKNLDVTKNVSIQNSTINLPTEVDFNIDRNLASQNLPINCPIEVDLNITRESLNQNSTINRENEIDLNINKNLSIQNLPVNCPTDVGLNITRESFNQNSTINRENEVDLNIDRNLSTQNSSINPENKVDLDLTKNLSIQNLPTNPEIKVDLDLTRNSTIENLLINPENEANPDLDLTKDLSRQKLPINCPNEVDLDLTRDFTRKNFPENRGPEELERTRTIDGETEASLANALFECQSVNIVEANRENYELASKTENYAKCVNDQRSADFNGSVETLKKDEQQLAESVNSALTSKFLITDNEPGGLKGNEDPHLELIAPSLSDYRENFGSPKIQKNLTEPEKSPPVALESPTNLINDKISKLSIVEFPENSQSPSLPSLSSTCLFAHLNETSNLPISSNEPIVENLVVNLTQTSSGPSSDEQISNTPLAAPSLPEKFVAFTGNDFCPVNSLLAIQEPTFLNDQNFTESSIERKNEESKKLQVSLENEGDNLVERVNFPALEINKNITAEKSFSSESQDICNLEKSNLLVNNETQERKEEFAPEKRATIELKSTVEAETEKEIFYDSNDKREQNSSSESGDLNATLTLNDISLNADDILAVAESDQFAEFVPKRQSTALVSPHQQKLETCKSGLVAGASSNATFIPRPITLPDDYAAFVPQKQSTNLANIIAPSPTKIERKTTPFVIARESQESQFKGENLRTSPKKLESIDDRCNFAKLEAAANSVANDIFNTSLELAEDNDRFVSAKSELFHDPTTFDFLLSKTPRKNTKRDLRAESLYINFDPLVSNTSMLPQGNIQNASPPVNEARNGENNTTLANIGTPKRNPAIAAIDRLLFYSPMTANVTPANTNTTIQKTNDTQEKLKSTEETSAETINMAKELELVRTTVLQLEEQLEKLKIDHEEVLEKQASYKDKINQLQAQLAQEIKNKNEITVVVDEYEISISRLVAERERDRKNLDLEKAKLQEELVASKHHLDNTEAAFNDVHLKYERLKAVVAAYKSNEAALKESIQENVEIIKSLENRYEQVKSHTTARLEKTNQDLEAIRKQNDSETVRLHAMLRKAELKSNSLAELVEQKTKENKELAQILDEVIARVGRDKSE